MDNIMVTDSIERLKRCFALDTCHHSCKSVWSEKNRTAGHCAIASLVLNDAFGGEIAKTTVNRHSHYFNIINGDIVDITAEQFNVAVNYDKYSICNKKKMLTVKDTKDRYCLLKQRYT